MAGAKTLHWLQPTLPPELYRRKDVMVERSHAVAWPPLTVLLLLDLVPYWRNGGGQGGIYRHRNAATVEVEVKCSSGSGIWLIGAGMETLQMASLLTLLLVILLLVPTVSLTPQSMTNVDNIQQTIIVISSGCGDCGDRDTSR